MPLSIGSTLALASGKTIPQYGFGSPPKDKTYESMLAALHLGVRHIDTAQMYTNEPEAARAVCDFLQQSGTPRSEVFITTKWNPPAGLNEPGVDTDQVYQELQASRKIFVEDNGLEYVDLMLVHQSRPGPVGRANHWRALVKAQQDGWIKEIGVSNHNERHLAELPQPGPAVNQIEVHPWMQQRPITQYCDQHNIRVMAFCPLVRAKPERVEDPVVRRIGEKHGKNWAQVILRWSLQTGLIPIPASKTEDRIKANADIFDFELSDEDMAALDGLEVGDDAAASVAALKEVRGP